MYAVLFNALIDYLAETLLIDKEFNLKIECVFGIASVDKAEILRNGIVEYDFTESCGNKLSNLFTVYLFGHTNFNFGMKTDVALVVSHGSLINAEERFAFISCVGTVTGLPSDGLRRLFAASIRSLASA